MLPCSHRYIAYGDSREQPNIVVDGRANEGTVLTLSHWPKSGTPQVLKGDTSVDVVFNYLDAPEHHVDAVAVTNNHFDEDGLIGLHCLIEPEAALPHRELLIGVAHAGDFDTYRDRRAARIAFSISRLSDRRLSPWADVIPKTRADYAPFVYRRLLEQVGAIIADVEGHRDLWAEEDELLTLSERALDDGEVSIEEVADVDLAIVRVSPAWVARTAHPLARHRAIVIHPMAVHNRTACNRIATICGDRYRFGYRYESWVQMTTHRPPPRIDLRPLAAALSEQDRRSWRFDGVEQITPKLRAIGRTNGLNEDVFLDALREALAAGAPAWDPYDELV